MLDNFFHKSKSKHNAYETKAHTRLCILLTLWDMLLSKHIHNNVLSISLQRYTVDLRAHS